MTGRPKRRSRETKQRPSVASGGKVHRRVQAPGPLPATALPPGLARGLTLAALMACAALPYLNILLNGFVYDDDTQLLQNPYVRSLQHLTKIFTTHVWSFQGAATSNFYRPMMTLGYLLCYKVFGMRAWGFHLVSILLHTFVVCLVFVLAERLTGDRVLALVAGVLFALHPIHTESVSWIAAVPDLEVTFFYLLAFGFFLAAARPEGGCSRSMLAAMGGTFLLGLLSKEQAMTLPALATVYEHFFRADRGSTTLFQKSARYGLLWVIGVAYVFLRIHFLGSLAPHELFSELTPFQTLLSAVALVSQYVGKLFWPVRLCLFHVFHASESLSDLRVLAGLAILLALAAFVLVYWRSQDRGLSTACFGAVWFLATLAPVLNAHWVGENVFAERYLYLPSVGFAWIAGLGASKLWSRAGASSKRRAGLVLLGLVLAGLCAARIVSRNRDWNNNISLYNQTLELSPDAYIIYYNLGYIHWQQGELEQAESAWRQALALRPYNSGLLYRLGLVLSDRHQYAEAVRFFRRVSAMRPTAAQPHLDLGETYIKMGLKDEAESHFRAAVRLSPLDPRARNDLGELLFQEGRTQEAAEEFRASIRIEPSVSAYDFLGTLDLRRHDAEVARRDFQAALALDPSDSKAHFGLGEVYALAGRKAEALSEYEAGLKKDPNNSEALAAVRNLRQTIPSSPQ